MKIYSEILNYSQDVAKTALGEFGLSLYKFSENIDLNHFGLKDVPLSEDLSDRLCQILNLVNYSINNNLKFAIQGIDKFYNKSIPVDIKNLDKKFVRLIKDEKHRNQLRKNKKSCEISLLNFYDKARMIWDNLPNDFTIFSKNNDSYKQMIFEAELKAKRYKDLGCNELYLNICDSINNIHELMKDVYCGYRRVSLRNASIILAKINGFNLIKRDTNNLFDNQRYSISSSKSTYVPKIYPLHYLEHMQTDHIKSLILELENPALFDHYMVLVPSTKSKSQEKDFDLVDNKNIVPIVLGEKDGKCYFISYWI